MVPRVVLDTDVLVAGLRSRRGAAFRLLTLVGTRRFTHVVSVPLVLEYEDVLKRRGTGLRLSPADVDSILYYLCGTGEHQPIHFLWRPLLPDPRDDMVLEAAVNGQCDRVVTFNERDFLGSERVGVTPVSPFAFLEQIRGIP
jgi:putative PIN family toxin of toxin-antitoxin system